MGSLHLGFSIGFPFVVKLLGDTASHKKRSAAFVHPFIPDVVQVISLVRVAQDAIPGFKF